LQHNEKALDGDTLCRKGAPGGRRQRMPAQFHEIAVLNFSRYYDIVITEAEIPARL
jgi:hypothetical protein